MTVVFANDMFELGCQLFSEIDFVTEVLEKKMSIYSSFVQSDQITCINITLVRLP